MEGGKEEGEAKGLVTKRQEGRGKELLPAYNEVIEETASKLAEKKSKVRALVGAFETVILLQEPESQTSQVSEEKEAKVADEMIQQKPEEEAVGEKSSKLDQELQKSEAEETNNEGSQRQQDVEEQKSIEKEERKGVVEEGELVGQETEQQEESGLVIEESKERKEKTESVEEVQRESSNE